MFLGGLFDHPRCQCFPRARGDVPPIIDYCSITVWFSPRTRGCSSSCCKSPTIRIVFPAHAGMFLAASAAEGARIGFPRARGDVPAMTSENTSMISFSPRTRGCSARRSCWPRGRGVFPAHAGMFRSKAATKRTIRRFPRARGDVPPPTRREYRGTRFSPRTRGCSLVAVLGPDGYNVFPAHAGMFLGRVWGCVFPRRFPRARGDVPNGIRKAWNTVAFSPRTRGCSPRYACDTEVVQVFPAHAGMFRGFRPWPGAGRSFPRARGDVPGGGGACGSSMGFSPRTRGCSLTTLLFTEVLNVFPAHAGMFLMCDS